MSDIRTVLRDMRTPLAIEAADQIDTLVQALQALVDQVNDYERVNNLAPNPGRSECWDTVSRAKQVLGVVGCPGLGEGS